MHSSASILSIGDELIRGESLDTNSRDLSALLLAAGVMVDEHVTIGDSREETTRTLARLALRSPLVIITGGLGPTDDDLTREALADLLGEELIEDSDTLAALTRRFAAAGREMSPNQRRQALRPPSATGLVNMNGTAPGLYARVSTERALAALARVGSATRGEPPPAHDFTDVFCLPGPPGEWKPMFEADVRPRLAVDPGTIIRTRQIGVFGLAEADAASRIRDLMRRDANPLVGITASKGVLTWRLLHRAQSNSGTNRGTDAPSVHPARPAVANTTDPLDTIESRIRDAMGPNVFASSRDGHEVSLPHAVLKLLKSRTLTLATIESCTGGMLGETITAIPGSSAAYAGGLVTYSNALKERLAGVKRDTLDRHGAVSREVAAEMASGGLDRTNAHIAVSITGIAGPDGGSEAKPVGTVWFGIAERSGSGSPTLHTRLFRFTGTRQDVRERATATALGLVWLRLSGSSAWNQSLLWERASPGP